MPLSRCTTQISASKLGGINTLQGGQVSGSRFAYLRGDVARMQITP